MKQSAVGLARSRSPIGIVSGVLFFGLILPAAVQQASSPPVQRVLHLWVDAVNGSDNTQGGNPGAPFLNPRGLPACGVVPFLPNDFLDPQGNVLLHAPWPFKTVTAAVAYLCRQSQNPSTLPPLPYTSVTTNIQAAAAIIHLMPGFYGSGNQQNHNGLTPNGETFPIHLPPNVSLRGASALDVVFDLSGTSTGGIGPALEFGVLQVSDLFWGGRRFDITGQGCFVDKVSFVGASNVQGRFERSAAVALREDVASSPTFTNCFFFKNRVGLAVAASFSLPVVHTPTVVNCTFADNYVGLWNGQYNPAIPLTPGIGLSPLLLVNNVFDGMPLGCATRQVATWPASPWGVSSSDFEGVGVGDLFVSSPNPWPGNYNAYNWENNSPHYNYATPLPFLTNYPATIPNGVGAIAPTLNIAQYTGWGATIRNRGVLFIRDLLCNGPIAAPTQFPTTATWDGSPMDFRLSPSVADASSGAPLAPSALNPLVDAGYGDLSAPLIAPITMLNGRQLTMPPGYISLFGASQLSWLYSCWNEDCEGFGNRRFHDHPLYPNTTQTPEIADIGADEADDFIRAGVRAMTTSFLADPGLGSGADNKYFIYLGPANQSAAGRLPDSRATQFSTHPDLNSAYSRTIGGTLGHNPWAATWTYGPTGAYYYPTRVDVIPHLLPDIHPWWGFLPLASPSLCLWQHCLGFLNYNHFLFADPEADVVHAPGAGSGFLPAYEWLDGFTAFGSFGVTMTAFGPWGPGPASINQFTAWCVGTDAAASVFFDTLPITGSLTFPNVGLRFSAEFATTSLFGSLETNLQTMHVFVR